MEGHEGAKQEDSGQFDDSAPGHVIVPIIEEIEAIAADGQDDERIQLPELLPGNTGRGYRMVFHLVVRDRYWI